MNALSPLVREDEIVLEGQATNRAELLALASRLLGSHHGLSPETIRSALEAREAMGSTAMGHGIAIPHARLPGLREPALAYIRLRAPIDFGAHDGKPVSQFLVLIVPSEANEKHLKLMAAAAGALSDKLVRNQLRTCAGCGEAKEALSRWAADAEQGPA